MLPQNENQFRKCMFRETARSAYPGGMSMYGKGIVNAGNKQQVSDFFVSSDFCVPQIETFQDDHREICNNLSEHLLLNTNRPRLDKVTVAAKFVDTFLYQLTRWRS